MTATDHPDVYSFGELDRTPDRVKAAEAALNEVTFYDPPAEVPQPDPQSNPKHPRPPKPNPAKVLDDERANDKTILDLMETNRQEIARLTAENRDLSERHAYYAGHIAWLEKQVGDRPAPRTRRQRREPTPSDPRRD